MEHFYPLFDSVEQALERTMEDRISLVRNIPNDVFGLATWRYYQMRRWPILQSYLSPLPSEEVQSRFAGGRGEALLPKACFFANYIERIAYKLFGRSDLRYLDYGCGWGRLTRFLPRLTEFSQITAVDPLEEVKDYLGSDALRSRFSCIPACPEIGEIPGQHDIAFLFSVMTHTPPRVNVAIASALHKCLDNGGILITTVRPKSFWSYTKKFWAGYDRDKLELLHDNKGYACMMYPDNENYGDVSYHHEYFRNSLPGFELIEMNYCAMDPFQILYCFRKV